MNRVINNIIRRYKMNDIIKNGKYEIGVHLTLIQQMGVDAGLALGIATFNHDNYEAFGDATKNFSNMVRINGIAYDNREVLFIYPKGAPDEMKMSRFMHVDYDNNDHVIFVSDILTDEDIDRELMLSMTEAVNTIEPLISRGTNEIMRRLRNTTLSGITVHDIEPDWLSITDDVTITKVVAYTIPHVLAGYGDTSDNFTQLRILQMKTYYKKGDDYERTI